MERFSAAGRRRFSRTRWAGPFGCGRRGSAPESARSSGDCGRRRLGHHRRHGLARRRFPGRCHPAGLADHGPLAWPWALICCRRWKAAIRLSLPPSSVVRPNRRLPVDCIGVPWGRCANWSSGWRRPGIHRPSNSWPAATLQMLLPHLDPAFVVCPTWCCEASCRRSVEPTSHSNPDADRHDDSSGSVDAVGTRGDRQSCRRRPAGRACRGDLLSGPHRPRRLA